jgi:oligopeptide/dipeptide ABC transporter ATP-binding protein
VTGSVRPGVLLDVADLVVHFPVGGGLLRRPREWVRAVDGVSLEVRRGETMGLVGESGSGKTTVGRAIVRLNAPQRGTIRLDGEDLVRLRGSDLRRRRRRVQMIFQDPQSSLDPRQRIGQILAEPLILHGLAHGAARGTRIAELLDLVGLDPSFVDRYPHEFSGGQLQRIGIARALAVEPDLIVCDEPVSALDVSIQAQVVNLLKRLQSELGVAYLVIAHDLAVVRHLADTVGVMYLGKVVETGPAEVVYARPGHPYTMALLAAAPVPDAEIERRRRRVFLAGDIPSPINPPSGCRFRTRCWLTAQLENPEICATTEPPLASADGEAGLHRFACHFPAEARAHGPTLLLPAAEPRAAGETSPAWEPPPTEG